MWGQKTVDKNFAQNQRQKLELEAKIHSLQLDLENLTKRHKMQLEEEQHKAKLKTMEKEQDLDRGKKLWEEEKTALITKLTNEAEQTKRTLEAEHKIKLEEAVVLAKLDAEQRVKQSEITLLRQTEELKTKHVKEIGELEQRLSREYYSKLSDSLSKLHSEGNHNTKFLEEMTLKMLDKAPSLYNPQHLTKMELSVDAKQ